MHNNDDVQYSQHLICVRPLLSSFHVLIKLFSQILHEVGTTFRPLLLIKKLRYISA